MASERPPTFGEVLRRFRSARGLTQEELAERAGLSVRGISDLERNLKLRPRKETITLLADALGLSSEQRAQLVARGRDGIKLESPRVVAVGEDAASLGVPSRRHNLLLPLTSFIGRDREIHAIRERLAETRLLTLTGPGGCGKTRLALEVAASLVDSSSDGVWFADLAPLTDASLVPSAVLAAVGARESGGQSPFDGLTEYLRPRAVMLVLDNCEHLIVACAHLAEALLKTGARLRILATSRETLGIPGELVWPVPPLTLPDSRQPPVPDVLTGSEAVRLFVARAAQSQPDFALTSANAQAVAEICRRLDGLPLAIELAAARIRVLSVEQIAQRLDDHLQLLGGGSRTAPPRQQALRTTLDWSYDLLSDPERQFFRSLAMFAGGFSLEAAETIGGSSADADPVPALRADVLDLLDHLVEKSLVLVDKQRGPARYRLLETMRQYGYERLAASGDLDRIRSRHADFFLALAESEEAKLTGAEQSAAFARLDLEHDNLHAALRYLVERAETERAVRLGAALWRYWWVYGYLEEGADALEALAAFAPSKAAVADAKVQLGAGAIAFYRQDYARASSHYQTSLTLARELGDQSIVAWSLIFLGWLANDVGDYRTARSQCEESLAMCRRIGDRQGIARSLAILALGLVFQGDAEAADPLCTESIAIERELGDRWGTAWAVQHLALVRYLQGDPRAAEDLCEESRSLWLDLGDRRNLAFALVILAALTVERRDFRRAGELFQEVLQIFGELRNRWGLAVTLCLMVIHAAAQEQWTRAYRLLGAGSALGQAINAPAPPLLQQIVQRALASGPQVFGEAAIAGALAEGQAMTVEQVVAYAREAVSR